MMEENLNKINEHYLLVLKHKPNSKEIYIDREKILKPYNPKLNSFIQLCDNPDVELSEIRIYLSQWKELKTLYREHKYCVNLDSEYEGFKVDIQKTIREIDDKGIELSDKRIEYRCFNYNVSLMAYKKQLKKDILLWFKSEAIMKTYSKLNKDELKIFYSHRMPGWSHKIIGWFEKPYKINPDFSFHIKTNFGFGNSSYFYTKINFKGLDICPFTNWITYNDADLYEIINYSSIHYPKNESWSDAVEYILKAYNVSLRDETEFINNYFIDECDKFIVGLERIFNITPENIDNYRFLNLEKGYIDFKIGGHNLIEFKGKKLSGSLELIPSMNKHQNNYKVKGVIFQIEKLNLDILPVLGKEVLEIKSKIEILKKKFEELQPLYIKYFNKFEEYKILKRKLQDNFEIEYPEYKDFDTLYFTTKNELNLIKAELRIREKTEKNILDYIYKIRAYLHSVDIIKINASYNFDLKMVSPEAEVLKEYGHVKLIPYRIGELWYLYDIELKRIIKKTNIIDRDEPLLIKDFYLCENDKSFYILNGNEEYSLGAFYYMKRKGDYLLGLDHQGMYHIFHRHKLICIIPRKSDSDVATKFDIIDNRCIHLRTHHLIYGRKYIEGQKWESLGLYDFNGNKINSNFSNEDMENMVDLEKEQSSLECKNSNYVSFNDSFWRTEDDGLYFKETIKYNFEENEKSEDSFEQTNFHSGFSFLRFFDYCPEFGPFIDDIGYIDLYGNCYWSD